MVEISDFAISHGFELRLNSVPIRLFCRVRLPMGDATVLQATNWNLPKYNYMQFHGLHSPLNSP